MEEIFGYIENVVYSDDEKGFTVARLKEPKKKDLTCIVGTLPSIQPGESLRCSGTWKRHPQHGLQFEVSAFEATAPSDVLGIQKYLESGMIKGIGPVYAKRIVDTFGVKTLDIIDEQPESLLKVPGLGEKRVDKIKSCWQVQRQIREVMVFLRGHQVSPSLAQKIFRAYGDKSIETVKSNPYAMAKDIFGIGFKTADLIGSNLGIPHNSALRIDAGIEHTLWELSNEGHVCYPEQELLVESSERLSISCDEVLERVAFLIKQGELVKLRDLIWIKSFFLTEIGIARELTRIIKAASATRPVDAMRAIPWVEEQLKISLAPEQSQAVAATLNDKLHIITGGPGTGKSTITKAILTILSKLTKNILLAAPTGRAAKRMSEITGFSASTIHSLLEMSFEAGGFKRNRDNPLLCDLIIIDESSMIDTQLMHHLLKAIPTHAKVVFIGDIDQLPSVGPGNVLKDLINSERLPVTILKQIFRQSTGSRIITNAHKINQGEFPDLSPKDKNDFFFMTKETPEEVLECIVDLVSKRLPKTYRFHRFDEIQVLAPMKKGVIGTENLNVVLQERMNPSPHPLTRMGRQFHVGDKVMQIRNDYQKEVFNGDVGRITAIDVTEQTIDVLFEEKKVAYDFSEMDELVLAYAVSIHKYQGSECPCIVIPVHTSHFKMLHRNLLYTAITRGKKLVVLVGTRKALAIGIKNDEVKQRHTGLKEAVMEFLT
ncbi:MAG: ATP-dependent RecD-like DNA helicase [Simkania sp.]|nr:ATP-dependent RecD-like DNA helicase [Simkania sp.]